MKWEWEYPRILLKLSNIANFMVTFDIEANISSYDYQISVLELIIIM